MGDTSYPAKSAKRRKPMPGCVTMGITLGILFLLFVCALGPIGHGKGFYYTGRALQQARVIGLALFQYSNDHDGNLPEGKSSTEVFQALIDGGYISDPTIFYLPHFGKIEPGKGEKLKAENVCYDFTSGIDAQTPDGVPLVFSTGYKIKYAPGSAAVPLERGSFSTATSRWLDELWTSRGDQFVPGMAVCYSKTFNSRFIPAGDVTSSHQVPDYSADAVVKGVVPDDFKPDGKTYRQLTPEGALP